MELGRKLWPSTRAFGTFCARSGGWCANQIGFYSSCCLAIYHPHVPRLGSIWRSQFSQISLLSAAVCCTPSVIIILSAIYLEVRATYAPTTLRSPIPPLHTSHLRPWDGPNSYMLRFTTHAGRTLYSLSSMTWGGVQVQPKNMFFSSRLSVLAICSRRMRTARLGCVETGFVALFDNYATIVDFASYPNSADRQEYFSPLGPLQAQDQFRLAGNERNPAFDRRVEFDLSLMITLACPSS